MTLALDLKNIEVRYGGIKAVKGVNLSVNVGEIVALIGSNGAGKSSLLNAVCGLVKFTGEVNLYGKQIKNYSCDRVVKLGLAMVPEGRGIFGRLTVKENLMMGAFLINNGTYTKVDITNIFSMFPRLAERSDQIAGTLSGGEQQMLAIGRALMSRPKILLLDEPSMGLAPLMVKKIFDVIHKISDEKVAILLVEQNARLALEFASRAYVMSSGLINLEGSSSSLMHNSSVRKAYLGE